MGLGIGLSLVVRHREAFISSLRLLLGLEAFKKFVWWGGGGGLDQF